MRVFVALVSFLAMVVAGMRDAKTRLPRKRPKLPYTPPVHVPLLTGTNSVQDYIFTAGSRHTSYVVLFYNSGSRKTEYSDAMLIADVHYAFQDFHEGLRNAVASFSVSTDGSEQNVGSGSPIEVLRVECGLVHEDSLMCARLSGKKRVFELTAMLFRGREDRVGLVYRGPMDFDNVVDWISTRTQLGWNTSMSVNPLTRRGPLKRHLHDDITDTTTGQLPHRSLPNSARAVLEPTNPTSFSSTTAVSAPDISKTNTNTRTQKGTREEAVG